MTMETMTNADELARLGAEQLEALDTGQLNVLDTGQLERIDLTDFVDSLAASTADGARLIVTAQAIHKVGAAGEGAVPIISTLRYFTVEVTLEGALLDGTAIVATLVYEDGTAVTQKSQTGEPPLLTKPAHLKDGRADMQMKVTVLTSLLDKRNLRVLLTVDGHPHLAALTNEFKTITKLHRAARVSKAAKGSAAAAAEADLKPIDEAVALRKRDLDRMEADLQASGFLKRGRSVELGLNEGAANATEGACEEAPTGEVGTGPTGARGVGELWADLERNHALLLEALAQHRKLLEAYFRSTASDGKAGAAGVAGSAAAADAAKANPATAAPASRHAAAAAATVMEEMQEDDEDVDAALAYIGD